MPLKALRSLLHRFEGSFLQSPHPHDPYLQFAESVRRWCNSGSRVPRQDTPQSEARSSMELSCDMQHLCQPHSDGYNGSQWRRAFTASLQMARRRRRCEPLHLQSGSAPGAEAGHLAESGGSYFRCECSGAGGSRALAGKIRRALGGILVETWQCMTMRLFLPLPAGKDDALQGDRKGTTSPACAGAL